VFFFCSGLRGAGEEAQFYRDIEPSTNCLTQYVLLTMFLPAIFDKFRNYPIKKKKQAAKADNAYCCYTSGFSGFL
jgi:hypothetical protein